jgi:predicted regulator of amino acid metabolism with ACT domain
MWREILARFKGYPAQAKVMRLLLERGFQVSEKGRIVSGGIEIPHAKIAREISVDRRVVDATAEAILKDESLKKLFQNLKSIPFLRDVAPWLNLGVIIITPRNAAKPGIVAEVTAVLAKNGISIRQVVTDDPYLAEDPKLTIITDKKVPGEVMTELISCSTVKSITFS